jgi:protein TonB
MISQRQKLTRYAASLAVVLGVHAAAIAVALHSTSAPPPLELPPPAMMIELAPLPEPAPPPPPTVVATPQPPTPVEEPPLPKLVEAPAPAIALPKPPPPKPKPKPQPPKPVPVKKPEPPQEQPVAKQVVDTPPAPPAPPAKPVAPAPSIASDSNAVPSWQSDLLRHLAKFKKYPDEARRRGVEGVVKLKFVVDADGKVLSFELASSSGNPALDRATLDMLRRAQPLPTPPKEALINGQRELTAPFIYSLDKRR